MADKPQQIRTATKKGASKLLDGGSGLRRRTLSAAGLDTAAGQAGGMAQIAERMRDSDFSFVSVLDPAKSRASGSGRTSKSASASGAGSTAPKLSELFEIAVDAYADVSPGMRMDIERNGLAPEYIQQLADVLGLPFTRLCHVLGLPKSTIAKKVATKAPITGASAHAALGVFLLLAKVRRMLTDSTADSTGFDAGRWLGSWIETPQNALAGMKPAEVLDTPTGFEMVKRTLAAIESGAYA